MEPFAPLRAAGSGLQLLFTKPWVVIAWLVVAFPSALAAVCLVIALRSSELRGFAVPTFFYAGLAIAIPVVLLDGAAYRSVLEPGKSGLFYLRAGMSALRRANSYGLSRNSRAAVTRSPLWWLAGLCSAGLYVAIWLADPQLSLIIAAACSLMLSAIYTTVAARSSLTHVIALSAHPLNALPRSWILTRGHGFGLTFMLTLTWGSWALLALATVYAAGWLLGLRGQPWGVVALWRALPSPQAWSWDLLQNQAVLVVASALAIVIVLREVLCERSVAEAYKSLSAQHGDEITMPMEIASF
jgi:hypothetical protein